MPPSELTPDEQSAMERSYEGPPANAPAYEQHCKGFRAGVAARSEARQAELERERNEALLYKPERDLFAQGMDDCEAREAALVEALKEAGDALAMYVAGIDGDRHIEGRGALTGYHASSSAGGRKALETVLAALAGVVEWDCRGLTFTTGRDDNA